VIKGVCKDETQNPGHPCGCFSKDDG